jgi:acetate kinase
MSFILICNTGSTSIKVAVYDTTTDKLVFNKKISTNDTNHSDVITQLLKEDLSNYNFTKVVHRIVFGGEEFKKVTLLDDEVITKLIKLNEYAPLHNPPALSVIHATQQLILVDQYAVFDSAFHSTIKEHIYLYGLPYTAYTELGIRRFGFHGISYSDIASQYSTSRVIACHLGGGSSVCAIQNGESINTSMGFSPEEGLIMATRVGDIGAGALLKIMEDESLDTHKARDLVNTMSGLLGISGVSGDMKELLQSMESNLQVRLAIDMYVAKIISYVGSYVAQLGGLDTLVFTGGVGEGSEYIRNEIVSKLTYLKNNPDIVIHKAQEELTMARSI